MSNASLVLKTLGTVEVMITTAMRSIHYSLTFAQITLQIFQLEIYIIKLMKSNGTPQLNINFVEYKLVSCFYYTHVGKAVYKWSAKILEAMQRAKHEKN